MAEKNASGCQVCGLPLKNPISVAIGIGPVCRGSAGKVRARYAGTGGISGDPSTCEDVKAFLKVNDLCMSCVHFAMIKKKRIVIPKSQELYPPYLQYLSETRPKVYINLENKEQAVYGKCERYGNSVIDGNIILLCPHMQKRSVNRLGARDRVTVAGTGEASLELTGEEIVRILEEPDRKYSAEEYRDPLRSNRYYSVAEATDGDGWMIAYETDDGYGKRSAPRLLTGHGRFYDIESADDELWSLAVAKGWVYKSVVPPARPSQAPCIEWLVAGTGELHRFKHE
jgi:hypothetical protein